jgi:hypothetical protein
MLEVIGDIGGLILEAQKTGSAEALGSKLSYLNAWGDDAKYTVQAKVTVIDPARREASVEFLGSDGAPFMYGGLVYHTHDNTWGVHT